MHAWSLVWLTQQSTRLFSQCQWLDRQVLRLWWVRLWAKQTVFVACKSWCEPGDARCMWEWSQHVVYGTVVSCKEMEGVVGCQTVACCKVCIS